MRAFLALDAEAKILDEALALAERLRERIHARWLKRDTMHVTVRFFGDGVELARVRGLAADLARGKKALHVRLPRLIAFPKPERARVLVLGVEDEGTLQSLGNEAEARAQALGFSPEGRAYTPHLTLARFREPMNVSALVKETKLDLEGILPSLTLFESKLGQDGPAYVPLETALLGT